jgi:hypothetical protein
VRRCGTQAPGHDSTEWRSIHICSNYDDCCSMAHVPCLVNAKADEVRHADQSVAGVAHGSIVAPVDYVAR